MLYFLRLLFRLGLEYQIPVTLETLTVWDRPWR